MYTSKPTLIPTSFKDAESRLDNNENYLCIVESPDDETRIGDELPQAPVWLKYRKETNDFLDMRDWDKEKNPLIWSPIEIVAIYLPTTGHEERNPDGYITERQNFVYPHNIEEYKKYYPERKVQPIYFSPIEQSKVKDGMDKWQLLEFIKTNGADHDKNDPDDIYYSQRQVMNILSEYQKSSI